MFGRRSTETIPEYIEPSPEEKERLFQEALSRIETVEGVDYLDGYTLPPDNKEVWDPKTLHYTITHTYEDPKGKLWLAQEEHITQSTLTNKWIRDANIRSIAQGLKPMFIKWEDVIIPEKERHTTRLQKLRRTLANLSIFSSQAD
jgi:hypothetical protein